METTKAAQPAIEKANNKGITKKQYNSLLLIVLLLLAGLFFVLTTDIEDDIFGTPTIKEDKADAEVELYLFNTFSGANQSTIEFWVMNLGEETATNVSIFVRTKDQSGTILYEGKVETTALVLKENDTCSGHYIVQWQNATKLYHTIEISWDEGRNAYFKDSKIL